MQTIFPIPPNLIAKIAAGEVIERPAFAVKELIENSLDAGAKHIKIEIKDSGLQEIIVADDGIGMTKEDLLEAFKPHTTSKILKGDLIKIKTLGFRGEALSSIAAISALTIRSRNKKQTSGYEVVIQKNRLISQNPYGMPIGTIVVVQNLFYSVPARKKFLKSKLTEFRHIVEIVSAYALSNPQVRFTLIHNNKQIFDLLPTNIQERCQTILGKNLSEKLFPLNFEESYLKIKGFIAHPQFTTQTPNKNFIFVNKRNVWDKLVASSIKESYGELLDAKNHPLYVLFIEVPYEAVDVNVHPRKEQVLFLDSRFLFDSVYRAISDTLRKNNLNFSQDIFSLSSGLTKSFAGKLLKEEILGKKSSQEKLDPSQMLYVNNTYLVFAGTTNLHIFDQHAVHERLLYEEFVKAFKNQKAKNKKFKLKKPTLLDLSFSEIELLNEYKKELENLGFEIEEFFESSYKVESVPFLFQDRNPQELIKEILEDLSEERAVKDIDTKTNKMLSYLACRAAYKAGDKLTQKQIKELIKNLEKNKTLYTCPHGRPLKVEIQLPQFEKAFKRKK